MSTKNKRILVFTDWYLPGYKAGGPIRSLANLVSALNDYEFDIVTRNTDHNSAEPYPGITPNNWQHISDKSRVIYFEESKITASAVEKILKEGEYDKIYLNSLFSPKFTLLPLRIIRKAGLQRKCILAPRGMLKSGALSVKARKKKIFLSIAKWTGLYNAIIWHATSEEEISEIQLHFPKADDIRYAPNLASAAANKPELILKEEGELKLVCIARISPEKGIVEAIRFLQGAQLQGIVSCDFYGTIQNPAYIELCKEAASKIPTINISFKGEVPSHQISTLLTHYHFFYMPTLGENFGHAIAEALNNATPVIISDRTPWKNLRESNAGWDLPLDEKSFAPVLKQCLSMNNEDYQQMCNAAFELGKAVSSDPIAIAAQHRLFE